MSEPTPRLSSLAILDASLDAGDSHLNSRECCSKRPLAIYIVVGMFLSMLAAAGIGLATRNPEHDVENDSCSRRRQTTGDACVTIHFSFPATGQTSRLLGELSTRASRFFGTTNKVALKREQIPVPFRSYVVNHRVWAGDRRFVAAVCIDFQADAQKVCRQAVGEQETNVVATAFGYYFSFHSTEISLDLDVATVTGEDWRPQIDKDVERLPHDRNKKLLGVSNVSDDKLAVVLQRWTNGNEYGFTQGMADVAHVAAMARPHELQDTFNRIMGHMKFLFLPYRRMVFVMSYAFLLRLGFELSRELKYDDFDRTSAMSSKESDLSWLVKGIDGWIEVDEFGTSVLMPACTGVFRGFDLRSRVDILTMFEQFGAPACLAFALNNIGSPSFSEHPDPDFQTAVALLRTHKLEQTYNDPWISRQPLQPTIHEILSAALDMQSAVQALGGTDFDIEAAVIQEWVDSAMEEKKKSTVNEAEIVTMESMV